MEAIMNSLRYCLAAVLALLPLAVADADWRDFLKSITGESTEQASPGPTATRLTNREISAGLRQALAVGAERAVAILGRRGGYLDDPQVHIPLPGMLESAAKGLRLVGQGQLVDDFETTVNRAAERAIPKTLDIVKATVRDMTLQDVRGILNGPDDSATRFLRDKAGARLQRAVRPVVAEATDASGATAAYKRLSSQVSSSLGGMVHAKELDLDGYVTEKALDGLYLKLADEERRIRRDPVARTTDLLRKVFGR
jgi:hypothetical protein